MPHPCQQPRYCRESAPRDYANPIECDDCVRERASELGWEPAPAILEADPALHRFTPKGVRGF